MNTVSRSAEELKELRKKLAEKYGDEQVFVVPAQDIPDLPEGFSIQKESILAYLASNGFYANRWQVEYNPRVRQPIPYIIIKHGGLYYITERLSGSGEARLVGKASIGAGGHLNPEDGETSELFYNGMKREIIEEVDIQGKVIDQKFVGILNDNSNEVSRDHLAIVMVLEVDTRDVFVKEVDKHTGRFYTVEELAGIYDRMESWTQIAFEMIKRGHI